MGHVVQYLIYCIGVLDIGVDEGVLFVDDVCYGLGGIHAKRCSGSELSIDPADGGEDVVDI